MRKSASVDPGLAGLSRREFLRHSGGGLGGIALSSMLAAESMPRGSAALLRAAKCKRVIHLFMAGAASHLDLFDYKPLLEKLDGKPSDFGEPVETFQDGLGPWLKPVWPFAPHGQCGKLLGETVSPLGKHVDRMAFIHNVVSKSGVHSQATLLQATGFLLPGFPGAGCWASYGLGSLNENLPTFVVLPDHRGFASNGVKNWDAAFLPSQHSGTVIYPGAAAPIADLQPHRAGDFITEASERDAQALLAQLNRNHAAAREVDSRLFARIRSYELAARMQLAAPEAMDLKAEPLHVLKLYGLERGPQQWPKEINDEEEAFYFAQKCLTARRLLERGVRFVQIWSGNDNSFPRRNWDSHEDIRRDHGPLSHGMAVGTAALIEDLAQRGMLMDTLILWTTEFGRMPSSQGGKGRDHNPFTFTNWLCGGGIKGGVTHGESDEWGYKPLDRANPTMGYDIHATMLHLLGIDHQQLTFRHNGIDRRLTDVHGHVIQPILS
ncbi:hypothetical protein LBMAG49_22330 [Planctomycetota bacterium]|nr:DUF1501 domain-containing protein [Planctomycetota bacterium]MSR39162.1 DUF1501 domain-containing protein [Planctomycetota bacterium]GDY02904.1 hypothetical protein LBMAG49_22330 [Planctomycetota bacterium]